MQSISMQVGGVKDYSHMVNVELGEAVHKAKNLRRRKWCLCFCCIILITVLVLLCLYVVVPAVKHATGQP